MFDSIRFDAIEDAIADIKNGKIIIVVDDENRENEGDFVAAAECVTRVFTRMKLGRKATASFMMIA